MSTQQIAAQALAVCEIVPAGLGERETSQAWRLPCIRSIKRKHTDIVETTARRSENKDVFHGRED